MHDIVKMPPPEVFTGVHYSETIRQFINVCSIYFKLTGVKDENIQALFAKARLSDLYTLNMTLKAMITAQ